MLSYSGSIKWTKLIKLLRPGHGVIPWRNSKPIPEQGFEMIVT
jgi:hypothetical protein